MSLNRETVGPYVFFTTLLTVHAVLVDNLSDIHKQTSGRVLTNPRPAILSQPTWLVFSSITVCSVCYWLIVLVSFAAIFSFNLWIIYEPKMGKPQKRLITQYGAPVFWNRLNQTTGSPSSWDSASNSTSIYPISSASVKGGSLLPHKRLCSQGN